MMNNPQEQQACQQIIDFVNGLYIERDQYQPLVAAMSPFFTPENLAHRLLAFFWIHRFRFPKSYRQWPPSACLLAMFEGKLDAYQDGTYDPQPLLHEHRCEKQQAQGGNIIVYKLVTVVDGERTSLSMAARGCSATYSCDQVTVPPIPRSPLFAFRTLDVAFQEYERIKEINKHDPRTSSIPIEIWMAKTTGEVTGPDRIPSCGVYYNGLIKHAGYGAGLAGCYTFFWQNVSYCLKHCIGKRVGQKLDPAITVCCKDLILLEQLHFQQEKGESNCVFD